MLMTLVSNMNCLLAGSVCLVMIMFLVAVVLRCRLWLKVVAVAMIALVVRRNCLVREGSALNFMVYLPWLMAVVVGVLQLCYVYLQKQLGKYGLMAQCVVVLGAVVVLFVASYQAQNEYMKKIYYYVRHQQWDEIINRSNSRGCQGQCHLPTLPQYGTRREGRTGRKTADCLTSKA